MLHHHQSRVLRHGLVDGGIAFDISRDYLVRPPLMAGLVRGHVEGQIHRVGLAADLRQKADRFREGNGVGKRFGERAVARKLDDAQLMELEGTEVLEQ